MSVGPIIFGTSPFGESDASPPPVVAVDPSEDQTCAQRRAQKLLDQLSSIFDKTLGESLQSTVLMAIATVMCQWVKELKAQKADTCIETANGVYLEVCGANYGVSRPNLGLSNQQYRDLIRLCVFTPKGTTDILRRAVEVLISITPTITEPSYRVVRIEIPASASLMNGYGLGFYPSANVTDTDATGRGRGYAGSDLSIEDKTGQSYAFGATLGNEVLDILKKLVMAGVRVEVVTV